MNTTATVLPLKLTARAFVSLPGLTLDAVKKLTAEEIAAIGSRLTDRDWELVSVERMGGFEIDLESFEDADLLPVGYVTQAPPRPGRCMKERAAEIGVSVQTCYRWQREDGIDVFNDDEVRALIARRRKHLWQVAEKFKRQAI